MNPPTRSFSGGLPFGPFVFWSSRESKYQLPERLTMPKTNSFFCFSCHQELPISKKYKNTGKCYPCYSRSCQEWRDKNKDKVRKYSREWGRAHPENSHKHKLKNRYGISLEEYDQRLFSQGGVCAICLRPETKIDRRSGRRHSLSVDHSHQEGTNRGLLCDSCNKAIGLFNEDILMMKNAINYLELWASKNG